MPSFCKSLLAIALTAAYPIWACAADTSPGANSNDTTSAAKSPAAANGDTTLQAVTISVKRLDAARNGLAPDTGSSIYSFDRSDIEAMPLGASTPLNQVLLQAPGVVQDSYGQLHIRGDHANVQYRIDGVTIPEPISGFGPAIDTRFASQINLITGALPAQYGYRTAGVVDIKSRGAEMEPGGEIGTVIGTQGHREINASVGATQGPLSYFFSGSVLENQLGIENPQPSLNALHDHTSQGKGFGYLSWLIDGTSRLTFMAGSSGSRFQIPNRPDQLALYTLLNKPTPPSSSLNANQRERNDFQVVSYQRTDAGPLDYSVSVFHRRSTVDYAPDPLGDLVYRGVAASIHRANSVYGTQLDSSYKLTPNHTLRAGLFAQRETMVVDNSASVFPADSAGNQTSTNPLFVQDNARLQGPLFGLYLQDEWKASHQLTVNYGVRYDQVRTVTHEHQFSPRLGLVYDLSDRTRMHAGYARYFTPPPTEKIDTTSIGRFAGTTNALPSGANTAVHAERSHYLDLGLSHLLTPQLTLGVDAYYRQVKNLQDEGQFGNALVYSAFNFAEGRIGGVEFTANYHNGPWSAYGNLARSQALGRNVVTGQFNFAADELAYIARDWVHLDHDQAWSGSAGLSYQQGPTGYFADLVWGSGLRNGFANTDHLSAYAQVNLAVSQKLDAGSWGSVNARLSLINAFDRVYELRDGTGIGVGAPQFGQRRTIYLSLSRPFNF
jgi:outer membrane receptor protein involved in Fe transport